MTEHMGEHNAPHVANIGERGASRRRLGGVVWLVVALGGLAWLVGAGAPRDLRLALFIPLGMSAAGFLQARERT